MSDDRFQSSIYSGRTYEDSYRRPNYHMYSAKVEPVIDDKYQPQYTKSKEMYQNSNSERTVNSERTEDLDEEPKTVMDVCKNFADKTSLQGVPFINISKTRIGKLIWTVIVLAGTGAMIFHLYYLFSVYLVWPKRTTVKLGFDALEFPAVSICNTNPIKKSALGMADYELQQLVDKINPKNVIKLYEYNPGPDEPQDAPQDDPQDPTLELQASAQATTQEPDNPTLEPDNPTLEPDNPTLEPDPVDPGEPPLDPDEPPLDPGEPNKRKKRFLDKLEFNDSHSVPEIDEGDYFNEDDWENVGARDESSEVYDNFVAIFNYMNRKDRIEMGHKISDMLIKCSFAGRSCYHQNFTLVTNPYYGNCFTLQSKFFKSRRSGPTQGLELILFMENHEFIRGITNGNGAQLLIHESGVHPQPHDEGIALPAASENYIGIKMIRISRLGKPFGECNETETFTTRFGMRYTRLSCQRVCEANAVMKQCSCSSYFLEEINMKISKFKEIPSKCESVDDLKCVQRVARQIENGNLQCTCHDPCSEVRYEKSVSLRQWPSDDYAEMLLRILCNTKGESACKAFDRGDKRALSANFVKVNIYFDDLNYQNITEEQDYEDVQFISDVGGTIGLWVGLSAISLFEIFQFFIELFKVLLCKKKIKPARKESNSIPKPDY